MVIIIGLGVKKKGNYFIFVGMFLCFVLEEVGVVDNFSEVYLGGLMMGMVVFNLDIFIIKGIFGILAFMDNEVCWVDKVYFCIKCGVCVDVCLLFFNLL